MLALRDVRPALMVLLARAVASGILFHRLWVTV